MAPSMVKNLSQRIHQFYQSCQLIRQSKMGLFLLTLNPAKLAQQVPKQTNM